MLTQWLSLPSRAFEIPHFKKERVTKSVFPLIQCHALAYLMGGGLIRWGAYLKVTTTVSGEGGLSDRGGGAYLMEGLMCRVLR